MARRLTALTRREFGRHTPREVREMVDGAQWRTERALDLIAWQTALLMNATGNFAKDEDGNKRDPLMASDLLGREPLPADPLARPKKPEPVDPEAADRIMRAKAALYQAQIKAAQAQGSTLIDVTPPEPS